MLQAADLTIRLNAADDVVIARTELPAGTELLNEKVHSRTASQGGETLDLHPVPSLLPGIGRFGRHVP